MAIVNKFNVNNKQVTLDPDIIENMSANDISYDDSFQYDENTVGNKLNKLSELDGKFYEIKGRKEVEVTTYDSEKNNGISLDGTIVPSQGTALYTIDVRNFQGGKLIYKSFNTGGAANRNSAFYKYSNGELTPVLVIKEKIKNSNTLEEIFIPEDAEVFKSTILYGSISRIFPYTATLTASGINLYNIGINIKANESAIKYSAEEEIEDFNWENYLEIYPKISTSSTIDGIETGIMSFSDERIGKGIYIRNTTTDKNVYVPNDSTFGIIPIPNKSRIILSYWTGSNDTTSNNSLSNLKIQGFVSTGGNNALVLHQVQVGVEIANSILSIKKAIESEGKFVVDSSKLKATSSYINVSSVEIEADIDKIVYIDDYCFLHYNVVIDNLPKSNINIATFTSSSIYISAGKTNVLSNLKILNYKSKYSADALMGKGKVDISNTALMSYLNTYEDDADNLLSDQLDGYGNMYSFINDFSTIQLEKLGRQTRVTTECVIEPINGELVFKNIPTIGKLKGYKFSKSDGTALAKYESSTKINTIFSISAPYYVNKGTEYENVDDYTLQFWVNISELKGNRIIRTYTYNYPKFDYNFATVGAKASIANYNNPGEWENTLVGIEVVARIEDFVCLRFPHLKTIGDAKFSITDKGLSANFKNNVEDINSLTIYNPVLLKGDCYPNPYKRYLSRAEKNGGKHRGKNVLLIGDSQYNNLILANELVRNHGVNFYDMHYGGHRLSIGPNYSTNTGVNQISHSWFYQVDYRKLVLSIPNIDYIFLTFSSNDSFGDANWDGQINIDKIKEVEDNYPTLNDILNSDNTEYNNKLSVFNNMSDSEKKNTFGFVATYCAYIKQFYQQNPYCKIFLCSVPISCVGRLTGTAIPDPSQVNQAKGEWKEDSGPDVARESLEEGYLNLDNQVRTIAKRYHAEFVDFRNECGLDYENFIYHCADGVHWHKDIARNCAIIASQKLR